MPRRKPGNFLNNHQEITWLQHEFCAHALPTLPLPQNTEHVCLHTYRLVLGKVLKPEAKWKKNNGEQRELRKTLTPTMWELKDSLTIEKNTWYLTYHNVTLPKPCRRSKSYNNITYLLKRQIYLKFLGENLFN